MTFSKPRLVKEDPVMANVLPRPPPFDCIKMQIIKTMEVIICTNNKPLFIDYIIQESNLLTKVQSKTKLTGEKRKLLSPKLHLK